LTIEWGHSAHLLRDGLGIASIHDTALENDVTVNPAFERGRDLFFDLARALIGTVPVGPVEWLTVGGRNSDADASNPSRHGLSARPGRDGADC